MMLTAHHLRKEYATVLAVDDVSLAVNSGSIFGLIGPNGAGKSTTIRMLLNITAPDAGTILFDGKPYSPRIQNSIGYLPEERGLYRKSKLLDTIVYFAGLRGIDPAEGRKRAKEWLARFDLLSYADKKTEELSKGNQQKIQFVTAILHDPDLVVLDEPFSGLDPVNQIVLKEIFQELKQQNKAIIFSTHQMESAEKLCDEICLIDHGRIVVEGPLKNVKKQFGDNALRLEYNGDGAFLKTLPFVKNATVYENYAELILADSCSSSEILKPIMDRVDLRKFEFVEPSLNSIFLTVVGAEKTIEQSVRPEHAAVPNKPAIMKASADPRVKKALLSLVLTAVLAVTMTVAAVMKPNPDWTVPAILCALAFYSLFRYTKAKSDAERDIRSREEAAHVE
ncbi:MAG: ABC transporter ATP-binding protein [Acidobacteriota bacterium]